VDEIAENVDLHPTFADIAAARPAAEVDGHSLVPLLRGESVTGWRTVALVEHRGPQRAPEDPDNPGLRSGNPTTYEAIRSRKFLYVEYASGEKEYHDLAGDPDELRNTFAALPAEEKAALHTALAAAQTCRGAASCMTAEQPRQSAMRN
jgi:arylsulfatase A-like enzyme